MSKLARVTEELESLIHPTASTVHEEDEEEEDEEKEAVVPIQEEKPTTTKTVEPEETPVLPQVSIPSQIAEEISPFVEQEEPTITEIAEPEQSLVLPDLPAPMIITTAEEENKAEKIIAEVSYCFYFYNDFTCV